MSSFTQAHRPALTSVYVDPSIQQCPRLQFRQRVSELYTFAERSNYIFSSPLGPSFREGRHFHLPRFVYFGPHTHEESLRLAFYAGADSSDLRSSLALLHLVERLALDPDIGQGLNLSFFPLLDATEGKSAEALPPVTSEDWASSDRPEVELLRKDLRTRAYHGFVRVEPAEVDEVTVTLRGRSDASLGLTGVELITSDDFAPLSVRWEGVSAQHELAQGPLALSDDLPFHAFELTLKIPQTWPEELFREAIGLILRRFIQRYRGIQAYGQHL